MSSWWLFGEVRVSSETQEMRSCAGATRSQHTFSLKQQTVTLQAVWAVAAGQRLHSLRRLSQTHWYSNKTLWTLKFEVRSFSWITNKTLLLNFFVVVVNIERCESYTCFVTGLAHSGQQFANPLSWAQRLELGRSAKGLGLNCLCFRGWKPMPPQVGSLCCGLMGQAPW